MLAEIKADTALVALRQILRATELSSRRLAQRSGLTPSQLIILQLIGKNAGTNPSVIAKEAGLTQATVTSLLDKLERAKLINRQRDTDDMRRIIVRLTDKGRETLDGAPDLLQDQFSARFGALEDWEQSYLIAALERVASMLGADDLDASPVLDIGAIDEANKV